jgi:hypothetical protein
VIHHRPQSGIHERVHHLTVRGRDLSGEIVERFTTEPLFDDLSRCIKARAVVPPLPGEDHSGDEDLFVGGEKVVTQRVFSVEPDET